MTDKKYRKERSVPATISHDRSSGPVAISPLEYIKESLDIAVRDFKTDPATSLAELMDARGKVSKMVEEEAAWVQEPITGSMGEAFDRRLKTQSE